MLHFEASYHYQIASDQQLVFNANEIADNILFRIFSGFLEEKKTLRAKIIKFLYCLQFFPTLPIVFNLKVIYSII